MRAVAYSVLCIALVLITVIVAAALVPLPALAVAQAPAWLLALSLLTVGIVGAIGGVLAAILMHLIVGGRIPAASYIYPAIGTFWGVAVVLVFWKFASPSVFSTGVVQILLQTAAITVGLYLGNGLAGMRKDKAR